MGVSREDREAYERGQADAEWERENPVADFIQEGIEAITGESFRGSDSEKSAYDKGHSGKQLDDNDCSSSSGCYITTACLDAMNLPRNSLEMRAMKILTRKHILRSFSGRRDFLLYGRKAPVVVQAIEARSDAREIWNGVYERLKSVTENTVSGNYKTAHEEYRDLVLGLEREFVPN